MYKEERKTHLFNTNSKALCVPNLGNPLSKDLPTYVAIYPSVVFVYPSFFILSFPSLSSSYLEHIFYQESAGNKPWFGLPGNLFILLSFFQDGMCSIHIKIFAPPIVQL